MQNQDNCYCSSRLPNRALSRCAAFAQKFHGKMQKQQKLVMFRDINEGTVIHHLKGSLIPGHKSLATTVYLLYSQADWLNGSVATTNMVTELVSSQSKHCIF